MTDFTAAFIIDDPIKGKLTEEKKEEIRENFDKTLAKVLENKNSDTPVVVMISSSDEEGS